MDDYLDTSGDTGPTSDANVLAAETGDPTTNLTGTTGSGASGTGTLTQWINTLSGVATTVNGAINKKPATVKPAGSNNTLLIAGGAILVVLLLVIGLRK